MEPKFVDIKAAEAIRMSVEKRNKGPLVAKIRDNSLFKSAIEGRRNARYDTLAEYAADYLRAISKNHPLVDGNKRFALLIMSYFLLINGTAPLTSPTPQHPQYWGEVIEAYIAKQISHAELSEKIAHSLQKINVSSAHWQKISDEQIELSWKQNRHALRYLASR